MYAMSIFSKILYYNFVFIKIETDIIYLIIIIILVAQILIVYNRVLLYLLLENITFIHLSFRLNLVSTIV